MVCVRNPATPIMGELSRCTRHAANEKILIESLHETDFAVESFLIDMLLGVPNRFTECFGDVQNIRRRGRCGHSVSTDNRHSASQREVIGHAPDKIEFGRVPIVEAVDIDFFQAVGIH